jgi:hypothetical protein
MHNIGQALFFSSAAANLMILDKRLSVYHKPTANTTIDFQCLNEIPELSGSRVFVRQAIAIIKNVYFFNILS